jgi:hypothetical protein
MQINKERRRKGIADFRPSSVRGLGINKIDGINARESDMEVDDSHAPNGYHLQSDGAPFISGWRRNWNTEWLGSSLPTCIFNIPTSLVY